MPAQLTNTPGYKIIHAWLAAKSFVPFAFQQETWQHVLDHKSGLVNAPTGCGKTFSVFLGAVIKFINDHPNHYKTIKNNGLQLLWVTPLRALGKDIARAMEEVIADLGMQWKVGIRNGDTSTAERAKQKRQMPEVMLITPESLHLMLAMKDNAAFFKTLKIIAIDEWHELLGSKRGVQVELAVSRMYAQCLLFGFTCCVWGISATIGNLDEAREVLLSPLQLSGNNHTASGAGIIVKANINKLISVESIFPDEIEKYPWAGHLGIKLAEKVLPILDESRTTLIFINTRGMAERWYQKMLEIAPQLSGAIALHHGSIEQELRLWVEDNLHTGRLKAVICTASLDLGVDFRPVETVIQVGSPKGVSRFLQRAGRAGHQPGEVSKIYFLPTHSLELMEAAALKTAITNQQIESREPMLLCFDVLIQYLCTLAVGGGFRPQQIFKEIKSTYCFQDITEDEWSQVLLHITEGGTALKQYDEYKKVEVDEQGLYVIKNRRLAMRHRMHIGTIVSDAMLKVKFLTGGYIGHIEEYFISRLDAGDVFTLAGRNLELVQIKDMTVMVRKSNSPKSIVPSWNGGRMSLTANLGRVLRETMDIVATKHIHPKKYIKKAAVHNPQPEKLVQDTPIAPELLALQPLLELQRQLSYIPHAGELLIEHIEDRDGFHLVVYPFEGRLVHEALSAILAYRIGKLMPITFSIAMNDYGFELLSDRPIPLDDSNVYELLSTDNLLHDMQASTNSVEMASRKFRDIAVIGGLIFQGMPGEQKKARHLQSSASLIFRVLTEFDPNNILLRQAYNEVFLQQMEEVRLRNALQRISQSNIIIKFPERLTPLSFPIVVDGLNRNNLTTEKIEDRIRKMQAQLAK